jgi:D-serine deaminase-like pyridoxal phosphate-dependent protein
MEWYEIEGVSTIDTPALIVYKDRISENINRMIKITGNPDRLMPHIKTHKMVEVVKLQIDAGITRFKCATIAEAEIIGMAGANEALIAYQPVGPKGERILNLVARYPKTIFSVVVDCAEAAEQLAHVFKEVEKSIDVYIDIDAGMKRTGIPAGDEAFMLYEECDKQEGISFKGLHVYDGHIHDSNRQVREKKCEESFHDAFILKQKIEKHKDGRIEFIAGGTPTLPIHANSEERICSPGTPVLWDFGYGDSYSDLDFLYAAVVISRVISKIDNNMLCLDMGYKAIAAESPMPRVRFLNSPDAKQVQQSEEHLVIDVVDNSQYNMGDVFYGVPLHICPTCALHQEAKVVENNKLIDVWKVAARDRFISV